MARGSDPRRGALKALMRVYGGGAYADIVLSVELEKLPETSRPLATELVYGVLRHQARLDWIIDAFSAVKTKKLEHEVLCALRLGVYQLAFLSIPSHAVINETVELVKSGGAGGAGGTGGAKGAGEAKKAGFINAVLRKAAENLETIEYPGIEADPVRHISVFYSHPEWLVRRWVDRYGVGFTLELTKADNEIPPRTIRVNTLSTTVDALKVELQAEGVEVTDGVCCPEALTVSGRVNAVDARYYIQDEASQLVSHLVGPAPGETVLDACAAPGGKATHLAALMKNEGTVYAVDIYAGRLKGVKDAAGMLGATIVRPFIADATGLLSFTSSPEGFDAVLLDAPCSGLGVLRRSPDIKLRRTEEDISRLSARQGRLLRNLAGQVKRGGRLVYSVCTFEPEETDRVVKGFLSENKGFVIEDAKEYLPRGCEEMVDGEGFLRTYPHRHSMDGFFAARLKRT